MAPVFCVTLYLTGGVTGEKLQKGRNILTVIFAPGVFSKGEKKTHPDVVLSVSLPLKNGFLSALCHQSNANQLNRGCSLVPKLCQIHTLC